MASSHVAGSSLRAAVGIASPPAPLDEAAANSGPAPGSQRGGGETSSLNVGGGLLEQAPTRAIALIPPMTWRLGASLNRTPPRPLLASVPPSSTPILDTDWFKPLTPSYSGFRLGAAPERTR